MMDYAYWTPMSLTLQIFGGLFLVALLILWRVDVDDD